MHKIPTIFKNEVYCNEWFDYNSESELLSYLPNLIGKKYIHVGKLSNVMFRTDFNGVILHSNIKDIEIIDNNTIKIGAGLTVDELVQYCIKNDVYFPFLKQIYGIPAEMGGIVVNNASLGDGIHKSVIKVHCVNLQTGEIKDFARDECNFAYRTSIFRDVLNNQWAVVYIYFQYFKAKNNENELTAVVKRRTRNFLPTTDEGYSGCMFYLRSETLGNYGQYLNHPDVKKLTSDNVYILEKFPWRFVNKDNKASGEELYQLSERVIEKVFEKYNVKIEREVQFV